MKSLAPCPCCKSNDVDLNGYTSNSLVEGYFIHCYSCHTCGPTAKDAESACDKWNDMPRVYQEDVIELPKDAENIPVHPGDVLYGGEDDDWVYHVDEIIYKVDEDGEGRWSFIFKNDGVKYTRNPEFFSHHPQTPLDEIKRDVYYLAKKSGLNNPQETTADIIERIVEFTEKR